MMTHKLISADSHIVEPPDLYTKRIEPRFRDRAPRLERLETPTGRKFDAWVIDGQAAGTLGAVIQAGQRFEDPSQIDFLGTWEDVRLGAYDPQVMVKENEIDGVWGACLQPSQGLFWYRIPDSAMLSAICRVYNDWIAEFCSPFADRLKGIAMLNVDDVEEASQELERCAKLGLVGAFIPVAPLPERPYRHPIYDRLWWTAQDLGLPLLLHIGTPRGGVPGCEFTMDLGELTGGGSVHDRLLGALLTRRDALRGCLRSLSEAPGRLGRARGRVDPSLAEADGLHVPGAARIHEGLEVEGGTPAQRLLAPQHVRGVHGGRPRRAPA
jgi:hypothetical protein